MIYPSVNEFYLKSEAGQRLAELELQLAKAQLVQRLNEPKALYSNLEIMSRLNHKIDVVERRELHQKYKRCLAMAKLCNEKWLVHNFAEIPTKLRFYDKWEKRWLELAEKFKEAK